MGETGGMGYAGPLVNLQLVQTIQFQFPNLVYLTDREAPLAKWILGNSQLFLIRCDSLTGKKFYLSDVIVTTINNLKLKYPAAQLMKVTKANFLISLEILLDSWKQIWLDKPVFHDMQT